MQIGKKYTTREVADYCNLNQHTVWRAVKSKSLNSSWDSQHNRWMVLFEDMLDWRKRVADRKRGKESE